MSTRYGYLGRTMVANGDSRLEIDQTTIYFFQLGRECVLLFFLYYSSVPALRGFYSNVLYFDYYKITHHDTPVDASPSLHSKPHCLHSPNPLCQIPCCAYLKGQQVQGVERAHSVEPNSSCVSVTAPHRAILSASSSTLATAVSLPPVK